jgi:phospholipid/cholesterol/gamma-HCH transport system substrate-binding protein
METRSNHILVGGIVLTMIVAVLAFVFWLSQAAGDSNKEYDVYFNTAVDGLAKGSVVSFSGVPTLNRRVPNSSGSGFR